MVDSFKGGFRYLSNFHLVDDTWGDTFWGICNGVGENNLGKILMRIRSELAVRAETNDPS